jgi:hypothetical protein
MGTHESASCFRPKRASFASRSCQAVSFATASDLRVSPARAGDMCRFSSMKPFPNTRSASCWLCARQRSRTFATVERPPRATGRTWSYSGRPCSSQRRPLSPTNVHRPPSRRVTSRFTSAGTCRPFAALRRARGLDALEGRVFRHAQLAHAILVHRRVRRGPVQPAGLTFGEMGEHPGQVATVAQRVRPDRGAARGRRGVTPGSTSSAVPPRGRVRGARAHLRTRDFGARACLYVARSAARRQLPLGASVRASSAHPAHVNAKRDGPSRGARAGAPWRVKRNRGVNPWKSSPARPPRDSPLRYTAPAPRTSVPAPEDPT